MKECTRTGRKVSILLAVYNPDMEWLRELLTSVSRQTYGNLEVIARDDCSPDVSLDSLQAVFAECLEGISWSLERNEKNLGSNSTFELLTTEAEGDYLAYCDQDDIWYPQKIQTLVKLLEQTNSVLVCSDMEIIDENGNKTADSMTEIRKRHVFRRGTDLTEGLLQSNFVTGCAMLVKREVAQAAVPFVKEMFHDHWLALFSSTVGRIDYTSVPLIGYRIHSGNQSGVLVGVNNKKEYYADRIFMAEKRDMTLLERMGDDGNIREILRQRLTWLQARRSYCEHVNLKDLTDMIKGKQYGPHSVLLESVLPFMPEVLFRIVIRLTRKGLL